MECLPGESRFSRLVPAVLCLMLAAAQASALKPPLLDDTSIDEVESACVAGAAVLTLDCFLDPKGPALSVLGGADAERLNRTVSEAFKPDTPLGDFYLAYVSAAKRANNTVAVADMVKAMLADPKGDTRRAFIALVERLKDDAIFRKAWANVMRHTDLASVLRTGLVLPPDGAGAHPDRNGTAMNDARVAGSSVYANLSPAARRILEESCSATHACDVWVACRTAGLMAECRDACLKSPACSVPAALPPKRAPAIGRPPSKPLCYDCLSIRVGRPLVVRGPFGDELDTTFPVLKLRSGGFRGFSSNATAYALDGARPWSMSGKRIPVLGSGPAENYWINAAFPLGGLTVGFIHRETDFNYAVHQTHKSMSVGFSTDEGLTWLNVAGIVSGKETPKTGKMTGEGDCGAVLGADDAFYLYCLRNSDWRTIVARAPASDLSPSSWRKYYHGAWGEPGLNGDADSLGPIGMTPAFFRTLNQVGLFGIDAELGGIKLSLSSDYTSFVSLAEPILAFDEVNWERPQPSDLYAYLGVTNFQEGGNQIDSSFGLNYTYLPPGADFTSRYLVFQNVSVQLNDSAVPAAVGVELSRWRRKDTGVLRTTNAPVIGNFTDFEYVSSLGYVLTKPPKGPSRKIEECVSGLPGHEDFLVTNDGTCKAEGYSRLRTVGWLFEREEAETAALYRCKSKTGMFHFASNREDCDGLGEAERLLGYLFKR